MSECWDLSRPFDSASPSGCMQLNLDNIQIIHKKQPEECRDHNGKELSSLAWVHLRASLRIMHLLSQQKERSDRNTFMIIIFLVLVVFVAKLHGNLNTAFEEQGTEEKIYISENINLAYNINSRRRSEEDNIYIETDAAAALA